MDKRKEVKRAASPVETAVRSSRTRKPEVALPGVPGVAKAAKRVRIQDVARLAQVSLSTVSGVLNEKENVHPDTRRRVMDVIALVGYQPSLFASNLARRQTRILGIIVSDLLNPFFAEAAAALDLKAREAGYETMLVSTNFNPQQQFAAVRQMLASRVAGVAMMTSENDPETFALLKSHKVATVYLDNVHQSESIGTVHVNKRHGMAIAVEHLLELGHRKILLIKNSQGGAMPMLSHTERQLGFEDALRRFGAPEVEVHVIDEPGRGEIAGRNAIRLALSTYTFTAVCAINDLVAMGALRTLQAAGIRIPEDVSVVGFDNTFLCEFLHPSLTSVATPREELAMSVVEMLVALIEGRAMPERTPLTAELIVRESTGPPRV